jgi:hypothetical protein
VRDPNGVALASRALRALAGGTALTDITLQATATYIAGSDQETGTAALVALSNQQNPTVGGTGQSLVTLNLTGGQRQEIRSGFAGAWVGTDGTPHALLSHDCFVDAAWFYPGFTLAAFASDPTLAITLAGQEVHAGEPVFHLIVSRVVARKNPGTVAFIQRLSTMHLYLDASTLLPAALDFNLHHDKNTNMDIPVEIRFGGYQAFNGVQVPTRIQRYIQNSLVLDLTVTKAAVNSGVPVSLFTLPNIPTGGAQ